MSGVKFGEYHSYDDWELFLTEVEIDPPEAQTYTVEVPGRDGYLDLTDVITDPVRYYNREIEMEFDVISVNRSKSWADIISEIYSAIHGQKVKIVLDDDPDYYYVGRCTVSSDTANGEISIKVDCEPYKYYISDTVIELTSPAEVTLSNDRMQTIVTLTTDAEVTLEYDDSTLTMSAGTYYLADLPLSEGSTTWTFTGDANVTLTYTQGRL